MNKYIVVTGGAGFIGSNLIKLLINKTKYKIISLDNYSSGTRKNHIKNNRILYIKSHTKNIFRVLNNKKKQIHSVFHFGEFARIYQSFANLSRCFDSNSIGSFQVFKFCLENKIKLIYSATSASFGNKGNNKNLSPYAFTKSRNLELLENFKKWYKFKYEIIYFYNVYGPRQICRGKMATVIGIFEDAFQKGLPLPVVKPGIQSRKFTHINDTIDTCYTAWKKDKCLHYSISNKKSFTILEVAELFGSKIQLLPSRKGERFASALTKMNLSNKVVKKFGKISLKSYIFSITKKEIK